MGVKSRTAGKGRHTYQPASVDADMQLANVLNSTESAFIRETLRDTLESLYLDRIRPTGSYIKGRMKERKLHDSLVRFFVEAYSHYTDLFVVQRLHKDDAIVFLANEPAWFKGWIDVDSSEDPYDDCIALWLDMVDMSIMGYTTAFVALVGIAAFKNTNFGDWLLGHNKNAFSSWLEIECNVAFANGEGPDGSLRAPLALPVVLMPPALAGSLRVNCEVLFDRDATLEAVENAPVESTSMPICVVLISSEVVKRSRHTALEETWTTHGRADQLRIPV